MITHVCSEDSGFLKFLKFSYANLFDIAYKTRQTSKLWKVETCDCVPNTQLQL